MNEETAVERLLRRDRLVIGGSLALAVALTGWHVFRAAHGTAGMDVGMDMAVPWTTVHALAMFVMWAAMMVAMMVPSATPVLLLFARHHRKHQDAFGPHVPTTAFLFGYLSLWFGFAAAATVLQLALDSLGLLSPRMAVTNPFVVAATLVAAGVYQLTPAKTACLRQCQNPIRFLSTHWRKGATGALRMGFTHGLYCLGCCWALMLVFFAGGVMNLSLVLAIALYVVAEKYLPVGRAVAVAGALVLIGAGLLVGGRALA